MPCNKLLEVEHGMSISECHRKKLWTWTNTITRKRKQRKVSTSIGIRQWKNDAWRYLKDVCGKSWQKLQTCTAKFFNAYMRWCWVHTARIMVGIQKKPKEGVANLVALLWATRCWWKGDTQLRCPRARNYTTGRVYWPCSKRIMASFQSPACFSIVQSVCCCYLEPEKIYTCAVQPPQYSEVVWTVKALRDNSMLMY